MIGEKFPIEMHCVDYLADCKVTAPQKKHVFIVKTTQSILGSVCPMNLMSLRERAERELRELLEYLGIFKPERRRLSALDNSGP